MAEEEIVCTATPTTTGGLRSCLTIPRGSENLLPQRRSPSKCNPPVLFFACHSRPQGGLSGEFHILANIFGHLRLLSPLWSWWYNRPDEHDRHRAQAFWQMRCAPKGIVAWQGRGSPRGINLVPTSSFHLMTGTDIFKPKYFSFRAHRHSCGISKEHKMIKNLSAGWI